MKQRFRRLRLKESVRNLFQETQINANDVIQPFFVIDGKSKAQRIDSMPGIERFTIDKLLKAIQNYIQFGGKAGLLFGISKEKDLKGYHAIDENGLIPRAIKAVREEFPDFVIISDVCLCAYLSHGHCGILSDSSIDNDATLPVLSQMALTHARSGVDFVAPSDMMDFRVDYIRRELDRNGFPDTGIISYSVKYASSFYGPFREAAHCAPEFGDRKTYQMNCANIQEALKEALQDIHEGADVIMVKPALAYLDVIAKLRNSVNVPIAAFHVSGEYAMIKAAAQRNWVDEKKIVIESLTAVKRAGAKIIFTYYAKDLLKWIVENR